MEQPIRILLLEISSLLKGLLEHAVSVRSDCVLTTREPQGEHALWLDMPAPDVVIVGLTTSEDQALVPALFSRWPRAQIMTVTQAGDDAAVYELRPRRRALGQMSPAEIVDSLRDAVHRNREPLQDQTAGERR